MMEQMFIKVKTVKNGKVDCIDKEILSCTAAERKRYYLSVSKGEVALMLEGFVEDKIK